MNCFGGEFSTADCQPAPRYGAWYNFLVATITTLRHSLLVRVTHWITAVCFLLMLLSGGELVISHPRFYWGEDGNIMTPALFQIPVPASRGYVKTGYSYVLPDQNGWSRSLHFQTAWIVVITGLLYVGYSLWSGHLRRSLLPRRPAADDIWPYNALQRSTYLLIIYGVFPVMIWTGLAMSPTITAAFPFLVEAAGGQQSARTIHFFATIALVVFFAGHVLMVILAGFWGRVGAMITGRVDARQEQQ
jgi:thiosulfate reductase cytochrome b subunit